jgi:hypothetical protein
VKAGRDSIEGKRDFVEALDGDVRELFVDLLASARGDAG